MLTLRNKFLYTKFLIITITYSSLSLWPIITQFITNINTPILSKLKINLRDVLPGKSLSINWHGTPIIIKNRTDHEIKQSRVTNINDLKDIMARNSNLAPYALAFDRNRCIDKFSANWIVLIATCTHLGCLPENYINGWYCSCHGSRYDNVGRIIDGPASYNLQIPLCIKKSNFIIIDENV